MSDRWGIRFAKKNIGQQKEQEFRGMRCLACLPFFIK